MKQPAAKPQAASRAVTVDLVYPIQAHGDECRQLTIRPPTAGDLGQCDGMGEIAMTLHLIHLCAGIPPSSVNQIDASDLTSVGTVIGRFFGNGRATGRKA